MLPAAVDPGLSSPAASRSRCRARAAARSQDLGADRRRLIDAARQRPELAATFTTFRPGVPQVYPTSTASRPKALGVPLTDVFATLQTNLGSVYVNDFNEFGRTYQVQLQAEPRVPRHARATWRGSRSGPAAANGQRAQMVPLGTLRHA